MNIPKDEDIVLMDKMLVFQYRTANNNNATAFVESEGVDLQKFSDIYNLVKLYGKDLNIFDITKDGFSTSQHKTKSFIDDNGFSEYFRIIREQLRKEQDIKEQEQRIRNMDEFNLSKDIITNQFETFIIEKVIPTGGTISAYDYLKSYHKIEKPLSMMYIQAFKDSGKFKFIENDNNRVTLSDKQKEDSIQNGITIDKVINYNNSNHTENIGENSYSQSNQSTGNDVINKNVIKPQNKDKSSLGKQTKKIIVSILVSLVVAYLVYRFGWS